MIHIFIMSPRYLYIVYPAMGRVDPVLRIKSLIISIRVFRKEFRINDLVRKLATYRESIPHYIPLRLAKQAKHLTQVVNKARQYEPVGMPICTDGLGRLQ